MGLASIITSSISTGGRETQREPSRQSTPHGDFQRIGNIQQQKPDKTTSTTSTTTHVVSLSALWPLLALQQHVPGLHKLFWRLFGTAILPFHRPGRRVWRYGLPQWSGPLGTMFLMSTLCYMVLTCGACVRIIASWFEIPAVCTFWVFTLFLLSSNRHLNPLFL